MKACGYLRVSSAGQEASGLSLEAQKHAISSEVSRRGWELVDFASDTASAKNLRRPGLEAVLDRLDAGELQALVVSRLDRLSRSVGDFASVLDRAGKGGWAVVCMDPAVDLTTPYGRAMASVAATFAQLERELIGQRTREGIAAKVAAGGRHGNERLIPPTVEKIIVDLRRRKKLTLAAIGDRLLLEGYRPPAGGEAWSPSTIQRVLDRNGVQRRH